MPERPCGLPRSKWNVRLVRETIDVEGAREQRDVSVSAWTEEGAIGTALREAGAHDGWEVRGWWPTVIA